MLRCVGGHAFEMERHSGLTLVRGFLGGYRRILIVHYREDGARNVLVRFLIPDSLL
jgi:hypothetical protein